MEDTRTRIGRLVDNYTPHQLRDMIIHECIDRNVTRPFGLFDMTHLDLAATLNRIDGMG